MKLSLTLDRAMQVLELISEGPIRASHIATRLELNRTVVHRLLSTLMDRRMVVKVDGRYYLGDGIRPLAHHVESRLGAAVTDLLSQLADLAGSTALVSLRSGDLASLLTFAQSDRRESVDLTAGIGIPRSLVKSPHGTSMLAFSEAVTIARLRRNARDRARFDHVLAQTERAGWSAAAVVPDREGRVEIAAPVFSVTDYADAALAIVLPDGSSPEEFAEPLLDACAAVSRSIREGSSVPAAAQS